MRIWDVADGVLLHSLGGNLGKVESLAVSPGGSWIASSCIDGYVRVWDPNSGSLVMQLDGGYGPVVSGPDGSWLAFGSEAGEVRRWTMPDGQLLDSRKVEDSISYLVSAPDGSWLAGVGDSTIYLWHVDDPSPTYRLKIDPILRKDDYITSLGIAPDGSWLAAGCNNGSIFVWRCSDGGLVHRLAGHHGYVSALATGTDERWVVSAGEDGTVRVWEIESGDLYAAVRVDSQLNALAIRGNLIAAAGAGSPYLLVLRDGGAPEMGDVNL